MATAKQFLAIALFQFALSATVKTQEVVVLGQEGAGAFHPQAPLLSEILERTDSAGRIPQEVINQILINNETESAIQSLVLQLLLKMDSQQQQLQQELNEMRLNLPGRSVSEMQKQEETDINPRRPEDCYDLLRLGNSESGVYTIYPSCPLYRDRGVRVWCDMDEGEGGWTVILQRRQLDQEQVDFNQGWTSYRRGFGDPNTEYWIGNDILRKLTSRKAQQLRVDMADWEGTKKYAEYTRFHVTGRDDEYRLSLEGYYGTAGDALRNHNNERFSTIDRDNDNSGSNCANNYGGGGFWFHSCVDANPNGRYLGNQTSSSGITWYTFNKDSRSMKTMTFKLKPASCDMD